jgi:magnesium-transporting ATPase (P-type)
MSVGGAKQPLDANNLLLRGSTLCKTAWAIGVAVNVGRDAKIVQNMTKAPRKVGTGLATGAPRAGRQVPAAHGLRAVAGWQRGSASSKGLIPCGSRTPSTLHPPPPPHTPSRPAPAPRSPSWSAT